MAARIEPTHTSQEWPDANQSVVLPTISWQTYEALLSDLSDSHSAHFAYDQGCLEIMVFSGRHEKLNRTLALLVEVVAEEMGIDVSNFGSKTFKRPDLAKGFEPDSCFYIQNEAQVWGKEEIDLSVDPPPDLVIEIDIYNSSLEKNPIYAAIGVTEIWRYDNNTLSIWVLMKGTYVEQDESRSLPSLTQSVLAQSLDDSQTMKRTAWLRQVRAWVRKHK